MAKLFSIMSNLQTRYHFKLDFQKVNQHAGCKWITHGTKHHKESLELPCRNPSRESEYDTKESEVDMFNPICKDKIQGHKHPRRCVIAESKLPSVRKPMFVS